MREITFERFAVMSVQYVQHSFDYFLNSIKSCGIKHIDFWGGAPHYSRLNYTSAKEATTKVQDLRKRIDSAGLDVIIYTPETLGYPFSYSSPEDAVRKSTIDYMRYAMEDARILGTNQVFINTGCGLRDLPRDDSWKRCVESIHYLCEEAETTGVDLVIEQLQPYESNLLVSQDDMRCMLNEVSSSALKVCIDVVAMEVMGENMKEQLELFGEKVSLIHYCDGDPSGHSILGTGNLPLAEYIGILEANDFTGYLSLEINDSIYWMDPHDSIERSVHYLHDVLGL
jgi:protein FrlC